MTADPAKDAERLAEIRKRFDYRPRYEGQTHEPTDEFLVRLLDAATQERDYFRAECDRLLEEAVKAQRERDEARRSAEALRANYADVATRFMIERQRFQELKRLRDNPPAPTEKLRELLTSPSRDTAQPTPDDVERALDKEARAAVARILDRHMPEYTLWRTAEMYDEVASLIAAARREGAELRALDEAVREFLAAEDEVEKEAKRADANDGRGWSSAPTVRRLHAVAVLRALAARDAAIRGDLDASS